MIAQKIEIETSEERTELIHAIASALRWYALTPHKRNDDGQDAAVLTDLLQQLAAIDENNVYLTQKHKTL
jgi:hypothetical protein